MDLMFGLATVDKMQGDRLGRQLAHGWMGWESKTMRRVRSLGAKVLFTLATWMAPTELRPTDVQQPRITTAGA